MTPLKNLRRSTVLDHVLGYASIFFFQYAGFLRIENYVRPESIPLCLLDSFSDVLLWKNATEETFMLKIRLCLQAIFW